MRFRVFLLLWGGLLACALPGAAQEAPLSADETARARAQFQSGVADYDAGRYLDALSHFQEAYRVKPHPLVRVNIANCFDKLDRPVEAIDNFEAFLKANEGSAQQRDEVRLALKELLVKVGQVQFDVSPTSARILIDERDERRAPVTDPVHVSVGRHRVTVALEGYETALRVIDIKAQETERVTIALAAVPPNEPATAVADDPAIEPTETSPEAELDPVVPMAPPPIPERADASTPAARGIGSSVWLAGGATVLLAVSAVVTGQLALSADREFDGYLAAVRNPQLSEFQRAGAWSRGVEASNRANGLATATDVLLGFALVGAGMTVYLYLTDRRERTASTSNVTATLGPGSLQLRGRF